MFGGSLGGGRGSAEERSLSSRRVAAELAADYDKNAAAPPRQRVRYGKVSETLFSPSGSLRAQVDLFIRGAAMPRPLYVFLRDYATGLIVMQTLESRHHLVGFQARRAPSSLPAQLCAEVRRHINAEFGSADFRKHFVTCLQDVDKLLGPAHEKAVP